MEVHCTFEDKFHANGWGKGTTYFQILFDTAGRLRVLGGQQGDEGYWTDFVVSEGAAAWQSYELLLVPLLDAVFLSAMKFSRVVGI